MSKFHGRKNELITNGYGELSTNDNGSFSGTVNYTVIPYEAALELMPRQYIDVHPLFDGLVCTKTQISHIKGGGAEIIATYEGSGDSSVTPRDDESEIEVYSSVREAAIETHPKFEEWAGTPDSPSGGIFDENGQFVGWRTTSNPESKRFRGITSYYLPTYTVRKTYITSSAPDISKVGSTVKNISGIPNVGGDYNWLIIGLPYTKTGNEYRVTEEYLLSGSAGWNPFIYPQS